MEPQTNTSDLAEVVLQEVPVPAEPAEPPALSIFREYFESLVLTAILALFGTTFILQAFKIPSSSMEDTLLIGDFLIVNKVAYAPPTRWMRWLLPYRNIARGDIVVFKYPIHPETHFVKRAIGLPGDRLRIEHRNVIVNGRYLEEPYKIHKSGFMEEYRDHFPAPPEGSVFPEWANNMPRYVKDGWFVVPQGYYFVMGDNRDYSSDSRYWGLVQRDAILGRPLLIYWSLDSTSREYELTGMARWKDLFDVLMHFPKRTRWERMFRPIHGVQE